MLPAQPAPPTVRAPAAPPTCAIDLPISLLPFGLSTNPSTPRQIYLSMNPSRLRLPCAYANPHPALPLPPLLLQGSTITRPLLAPSSSRRYGAASRQLPTGSAVSIDVVLLPAGRGGRVRSACLGKAGCHQGVPSGCSCPVSACVLTDVNPPTNAPTGCPLLPAGQAVCDVPVPVRRLQHDRGGLADQRPDMRG